MVWDDRKEKQNWPIDEVTWNAHFYEIRWKMIIMSKWKSENILTLQLIYSNF